MGEVAGNAAPTVLLADADVLIDYRDSDLKVLKEVGRHVARMAVLAETLKEVRRVTKRQCMALGIEIVEPETPALIAAGEVDAPVSYNDRLCFLVCRERGWTCVTNDRALRRLCRDHGVSVRYGLGLMVDLVALGAIQRRRAVALARQMQAANPLHINEHVLARFFKALADG